jgi:hypothetical protein
MVNCFLNFFLIQWVEKIYLQFFDIDTVVYTLPPGYYTEYLPEAIEKESDFWLL